MDDERMGQGRREPLWPADDQPTPPARYPTPPPTPGERAAAHQTPAPLWPAETPQEPLTPPAPAAPSISEEQTARIPTYPPLSAPPAPAAAPSSFSPLDVSEAETAYVPAPRPVAQPVAQPATPVSEAPTERIPTAPPVTPMTQVTPPAFQQPAPPVSETPTMRISAAPVTQKPLRSSPPRPAPRLGEPPPLPAPLRPPTPQRPMSKPEAALAWSRDHWRLLVSATVIFVALIAGLSIYNYAASLAAQPQQIVSRYCAALTHADYKTAYSLLAPALQAQTTQAQYAADGAARDTISGKVTACAGEPTQRLSALSFLSNPRSTLINVTLARGAGEHGQIALSRDAAGWHVAGLSAPIAGIDLGPLHTEQSLCSAFMGRDYAAAYGLLSAPFQREQGSEQTFAKDFGTNLAITGCEPALSDYSLDKADQRASFQVTLDVSVSGGGASTKLTLPAKVALVREAAGWRVDSITPTLGQ